MRCLVMLAAGIWGCASAERSLPFAPADLATAPDGARPTADLASPAVELGQTTDLSRTLDAAVIDQSGLVDRSVMEDFATIPDLSLARDLSVVDLRPLPDLTAFATWSTCVGPTLDYTSCESYCAFIGKRCARLCTTSRGAPNFAAEAWPKYIPLMCGGEGLGQTTCDVVWDDAVDAMPRWRCCCQ